MLKPEGKSIYDLVKDRKLKSTLEIGLVYGASAVCIVSAHEGMHTCVDPYQQKNYQNAGIANLESLGYRDRCVLYQDLSHNVLPKLHSEHQMFDFIFIDGDHRFVSIFVDFYYADLLLSENGYILFHDAWMRGTQMVASFIHHNRGNYKQIRSTVLNLILFQKSGKSTTTWDYFKELYTLRGLLSHKVITTFLRLFMP